MPLRISKKIFVYLFFLFILGTFNNKNSSQINFFKKNFEIIDLSEFKSENIINELSNLKNQNLFFLKKDEISKKIKSHKIIEKYYVFKNYPSNLNIKIEKTKFLAITKKKETFYYIGLNGNLINVENNQLDLPFIFGDVDVKKFLELKTIIDKSNFNFDDIKNFYIFKSQRWDIETKKGILIKLPKKDLSNSFKILFQIMNDKNFQISKNIDLRQNNQVIIDG
jgi:cell division protein FtsQ